MLGSKPEHESRVQAGWRMRKSVVDYVKQAGKAGDGAQTVLVEEALLVHQALVGEFAEEKLQLQRFAADEGLNITTQLPQVIAALARRGMKDYEKSQK